MVGIIIIFRLSSFFLPQLPIMSLMLTSDSVYSLINFLSFSRWAFIAMATASLPYFRWKFPDAERPFKVNHNKMCSGADSGV